MAGKTTLGKPRLLHTYEDQRAGELTFVPGTHRLVAAYGNTVDAYEDDGPEVVWDAASFRKHLVSGVDGSLYLDHIAWHPDGTTRSPDLHREGPGYEIESARYTTTGDFLAVKYRWRPPRGMPVRGPDGNKSYTYSRPSEPDGPQAFFVVVRVADGKETLRVDGAHYGLASTADHFGLAVAPVGDATEVVLIEAATGKRRVLDRASEIEQDTGAISFSPDGQALVVVTWDGVLSRWTSPDFTRAAAIQLETGGANVKSMAVHPQGAVFVGLANGQMMFVDPDDGHVLHQWSVPAHDDLEDFSREISAAAISDGGQRLATAHGAVGSGLRIWHISGP